MRPAQHAIAAGALGVPVYYCTRSASLTAWFCAANFFIDIDHLFDYLLWGERPLKLRYFFEKGAPRRFRRLVFLFHGYEWVLVLSLLSWGGGGVAWAVTLGVFLHILLDEVVNRVPSNPTWINPFFYFFTFRMLHGFRRERISRDKLKPANNTPTVREQLS